MLNGWISGARALALLRGALASDIFTAAPGTPDEISASTGLERRKVEDTCLALQAYGIFVREGDGYRLSPDFTILADPAAVQSLPNILAKEKVLERTLEAASPDRSYGTLSPEDVLAIAVGIGMRPASPVSRAFWASAVAGIPELRASFEVGGRHLELGCGAANALLSLLVTHPRLTAVGVEIDGGAVAEARRRAKELKVAGRAEFRHADARDLDEKEAFDTANWSQQFFPAKSRDTALAAAFRALNRGGYLVATLFGEPPTSVEDLRGPEGQSYAVARLVYGGWGVPVLTASELGAEIEQAGFEVVRVMRASNPLTVSQSLLLARRPQG